MQQGTDNWIKMRREFIGASDAPIIMGVNKKYPGQPKKTPYILWQEKLGIKEIKLDTESIRYGKEMEPIALSMYEDLTFNIMSQKVIFHPKISYMMASLDGISSDGRIAVEIKTASKEDHTVALTGRVPHHYYPQVQHQLACLGHDMMHYCSYHQGEIHVIEVKREDVYIDLMIEKEEKFWKHVTNFIEPPLTDDDYVQQGEEWLKCADELYRVKEKIAHMKAEEERLSEILVTLSEKRNSRAGRYKYTFSSRQGAVDYSKVPELIGVDLRPYRKPSITTTRLTIEKE